MTPLGAESGFASRLFRVEIETGREPAQVVCKLASGEAAVREAAFYREVGNEAGIRVPRCYHIEEDRRSGTACLVLEDLDEARFVDAFAGCSPVETQQVVDALAGLHAFWWRPGGRLPWAPSFPVDHAIDRLPARWTSFLDRHGDAVPPDVRAATDLVTDRHRALLQPLSEPLTLLHSDLHLDNIAFDGEEVVLFDWQRACLGHPAADLALFLVGSLSVARRQQAETQLLGRYHERFMTGANGLTRASLDQAYRTAVLRWWLGTVNGLGREDAGGLGGRELRLATTGVERWSAAVQDHLL